MKSKVALFDSGGSQVGETFTRRARQLVQQQRAEWISDSAIRFAPDAVLNEEEWRAIEEPEISDTSVFSPKIAKPASSDSLLYYMAEKRIRERKLFLIHSLAFIPGYMVSIFTTALFMSVLSRSNHQLAEWFLLFTLGAWTTPYLVHAFIFIRRWLKENSSRDSRHTKMIEMEMDKLKRLGYGE